jgi:hypothetical protein
MKLVTKYETAKQRQFKQVLNSSIPLWKVKEFEPVETLVKTGRLHVAKTRNKSREIARIARSQRRTIKFLAA